MRKPADGQFSLAAILWLMAVAAIIGAYLRVRSSTETVAILAEFLLLTALLVVGEGGLCVMMLNSRLAIWRQAFVAALLLFLPVAVVIIAWTS